MPKSSISTRLARLRVRHFTLLDLIADGGSLRKVSQILCVTQPAVTVMLQEVESVFGVQLVDRDRQGARLTPAGIVMQGRFRQVLNTLDGAASALGMASSSYHLRVGVLTNAMLELVPDAVADLRLHGPAMTFKFVEDTVDAVTGGVLDGSLDCAIGRIARGKLQSTEPGRLAVTQIQKVPMKVVCGSHNPLCEQPRVTLKDLRNHSWILLPRGSQSREVFEQAFIQQGLIPPLPDVESLSFYSNFQLVRKTDLLTIAPATAVDYFAATNVVRPVQINWPVNLSPLMFFCLKEMLETDAVKAFRRVILSRKTD